VEQKGLKTPHGQRPCVIKCHPKRADILAVGFENGEVSFVNVSNLRTFSVAVSESSLKFAGKEVKSYDEDDQLVAVAGLSWDPHEDNLIVSLDDGNMAMITF